MTKGPGMKANRICSYTTPGKSTLYNEFKVFNGDKSYAIILSDFLYKAKLSKCFTERRFEIRLEVRGYEEREGIDFS